MSSNDRSSSLNEPPERRLTRKPPFQDNTNASHKSKDNESKKNISTPQNAIRSKRKQVVTARPKSNSSLILSRAQKDRNFREMATTLSSCTDTKAQNVQQETNVDIGTAELNTSPSNNLEPLLDTSISLELEQSIATTNEEFDKDLKLSALPEKHLNLNSANNLLSETNIIQIDTPSLTTNTNTTHIFCQNDDEINQSSETSLEQCQSGLKSSSSSSIDDKSETSFLVNSLGCCEFDETQLVSISSSKAIQKCILKVSNQLLNEESSFWGINGTDPILMKLYEDHIQFIDLTAKTLLRSQPIATIKSWAVDDDNKFAFVVEDSPDSQQDLDCEQVDSVQYALLKPNLFCYVFRSIDDDDMSWKVARKLNQEINRNREQLQVRIVRNNYIQQMVEQPKDKERSQEEVDRLEELEASSELSINLKYIGSTRVYRANGIDVLNIAIDKCLANASKIKSKDITANNDTSTSFCPLQDAKIHISPSSLIIEDVLTGSIIVECRIRYLTFMGISRRDIRWCGFIMQNQSNKTFEAHCMECYPTAAYLCESIQNSCNRMYEKVLKNTQKSNVLNIIPAKYKIRETLSRTFSRIKLTR